MISSKEYANKYEELVNLNYFDRTPIPSKEPVFNVFLNTRKIEVNPAFQTLAMKGELDIETIWFSVDRYFDGEDLSDNVWAVQAINALEEGFLFPMNYIYPSRNVKIPENLEHLVSDKSILLGFKIPYDLAKEAGDVKLSLKCYTLENNVLKSNLNTETITLKVKDTINFSSEDSSIPTYPQGTALEDVVSKIYQIYSNEELKDLKYTDIMYETLPKINDKTLESGNNELKYADLKELPTINGRELKSGEDFKLLAEADADLSESSTNPIQNQAVFNKFKEINGKVEEEFINVKNSIAELAAELEGITFAKLEILNFSCEPQLAEIGSKVENILFKWKMNKIPKNISILQGDSIIAEIEDLESEEFSLQSSFEENTVFTLKAEDINNTFVVAESELVFTNKVYYGVREESQNYNWSFVESLSNNQLQTSYENSFEINVGENQYVYYVVPTEYGVTDKNFFAYGGSAPGGFISVGTVDREYGDSGKKVNYTIWRSSYPNLGQDFNLTIK